MRLEKLELLQGNLDTKRDQNLFSHLSSFARKQTTFFERYFSAVGSKKTVFIDYLIKAHVLLYFLHFQAHPDNNQFHEPH